LRPMTGRDIRVSRHDLVTSRAITGALAKFPAPSILTIVQRDPGITVHRFCELYLAGVEIRCYGGTERAYYKIWQRLHRARKKLGLSAPG